MRALVLAFFILLSLPAFSSDCMEELISMEKGHVLDPSKKQIAEFKQSGDKLLTYLFRVRSELHQKIPSMTNECRVKLKDVFRKIREKEDYIGSHYYSAPQVKAETIDFKNIPLPLKSRDYHSPYHTNTATFEFKSGDILITKGISFTSSTISEVVNPRSLFSHIVFLYVDPKTKEVFTMESYIGEGVKIFTIDEALRNENARITVLRMKDQELAQASAHYMFQKIKKSLEDKRVIPYDYKLDFHDNTKLSCEEIAYDAFKTLSQGKVIIPENLSSVTLKDEKFLKKLGLKKGELMGPGDMETDSRFDLVLDWTDYRINRDSVRKDAVMGQIFFWMNEHNYKIEDTFRARVASLIWSTRYIPGLWHVLAKLSGIPSDYEKDVPPAAIVTVENIKVLGGKILDYLISADEEHYRMAGRWMTPAELRLTLNNYIGSRPAKVYTDFHD